MEATSTLQAARDALGRHSWGDAFELFSEATSELTAADLEGLAEAAWWTARLDDCIAARERAYELYVSGGEPRRAAYAAIGLAKDSFARGESTIGLAWFRRAETLLEGEPECLEVGHLHRMRSVMALEATGDFAAALEHAQKALEIAEQVQDRDLLATSLHDKGRALIMLGRVEEGMSVMDEATVAAVSGELSPYWTAVVYCNTITVCKEMADYARAGDWTEAAKRWCERQAIAGFPGMCRVYRADILRMRGAWSEASDEASRAAEETLGFNRSYAAEAFYQLGEVRLDIGDLDGAEAAYHRAHELGRDPQPGIARLHLARDNVQAAFLGLQRALQEGSGDLHRAHLLPVAVEAAVRADELEAAERYLEESRSIASVYATPSLRAAAEMAAAQIHLARARPVDAAGALRRSIQLWHEAEVPFQIARARLLLSDALAADVDEDAARLETASATASIATLRGEPTSAPERIPEKDAGTTASLRRQGDYWAVRHRDESFLVKDAKGLHHLARLLATPGREHHVLDLAGGGAGAQPATSAAEPGLTLAGDDAGSVLDPQAKAAYRSRVDELRAEIDEAAQWGDADREARATEELQFLTDELAAAVGLSGRDRKAASLSERARLNVTRSIRSTIQHIARHSPVLGDHLAATVRTGTFCAYMPVPPSDVRWEL